MNSFATQQITQVIQLFSTFELNFYIVSSHSFYGLGGKM